VLTLRQTAYGQTGEANVNAYGQPGWEPSAYFASQWGLQKAFTEPGWQTYQDLLPYGRWPTDSQYEVFDWMPWAIRGSTPIAGQRALSGPLGQSAADISNLISSAGSAATSAADLIPQISQALPQITQAANDIDSLTLFAKIFFGVGTVAMLAVAYNAIRQSKGTQK